MKTAFLIIGLVLAAGGIVGLTSDKPLTLYPNGSKIQRAVAVSEETKTGLGIAAVISGLGIIAVALRPRREQIQSPEPTPGSDT